MSKETSKKLYELLVTKDLEPELLDARGKEVTDPEQAELFSFDWRGPSGKNYGTVVILLSDESELEVYAGDNIGKTMEPEDKRAWFGVGRTDGFLPQIKNFAMRNDMRSFNINNINRLKFTMQGMSAIREGLFESYYGKRDISYRDEPQQTRIMIKHNRNIAEGEPRHRSIESIYIETAQGERFRLPSRNLTHGRIMARHVAEGGNPYDAFGQHINGIMEELNTLGRFIRASRTKPFTGRAAEMVETAVRHYAQLKAKAKQMIGRRGYLEARDGFDPSIITDSENLAEEIRQMFIEQTLDQRIEEAIPVLVKLMHTESDMISQQIDEFDDWSRAVVEGNDTLPSTPGERKQLESMLATAMPVGPDAINAIQSLAEVFNDQELFDRLNDLAQQDPEADARPLIVDRITELGLDIDTSAVQPEPAPVPTAPPTDVPPDVAGEIDQAAQEMEENLDTDGVMMTRPSNMSSESVQRELSRLRILASV